MFHTRHTRDEQPSMDEEFSLFLLHLHLSPIQSSSKEPASGMALIHKQDFLEVPSPMIFKKQ